MHSLVRKVLLSWHEKIGLEGCSVVFVLDFITRGIGELLITVKAWTCLGFYGKK